MKKGKKLYIMFISIICCSLMIGTLLPIFAEDLQENEIEEVSVTEQSSDQVPINEDIDQENEQEKEIIVDDSQQNQSNAISKRNIDIWDGTSDTSWFIENQTTFHIETAAQLSGLANLVDDGNDMNGVTIILENDIYLNSNENPRQRSSFMIGNKNYFYGTLDGNNHTIHNIYLNYSDYDKIGFLRCTWGMEPVKNLTITGSIKGKEAVAMVAIAHPSASINNCTNKADITGTQYVAGIVSHDVGLVENCMNLGIINGAENYVAGIISNTTSASIIRNSKNNGSVSGKNWVGGITGFNLGKVTSCENHADVSAESSGGGIVGWNSSIIENCSSLSGTITVNGNNAGGIIGNHDTTNSIVGCTNKSQVLATQNAAGIVGNINGTNQSLIKNCSNYGEVKVTNDSVAGIVGNGHVDVENCINYGNISAANGTVGGILGRMQKDRHISDCKNYGDIYSTTYFYAGGICGVDSTGTIVKDCYNEGKVSGNVSWVGGILGCAESSVENCTNVGYISSKEGFSIGGIVGQNKANIKNCQSLENGKIEGKESIGGIAGYCDEGNNIIQNCQNDSEIILTGNGAVGGVVGYSSLNIVDCINQGKIQIKNSQDYNDVAIISIGGIVGHTIKEVKNCKNKGDISIDFSYEIKDNNEFKSIGGIAGQSRNGDIISCQNDGNIYVKRGANQHIKLGGIVGYVKTVNVLYCENRGDLICDQNSSIVFTIGWIAGGIVGQSKSDLYENHRIEECSNTGAIKIKESSDGFFGGIAGQAVGIKNCFNIGNIKGEGIIGGIVGNCYVDGAQNTGVRLENCYFAGSIDSSGSAYGIAGRTFVKNDIKNCYYDENVNPNIKFAIKYEEEYANGKYETVNKEANSETVKGLSTTILTGIAGNDVSKLFTNFNNTWMTFAAEDINGERYAYYPQFKRNSADKETVAIPYYYVTLPTNSYYEIIIQDGYAEDGLVFKNQNYQFKVNSTGELKNEQFLVKANGKILSINNDVYNIENIQEDYQVTIEYLPDIVKPISGIIIYGQTLKDSMIIGGKGDGVFQFADGEKKLTVKESGKSQKMIFIPNDPMFQNIEFEIPVIVQKANNEWVSNLRINGWTYGEKANQPYAKAKYGEVVYTYASQKNGNYTHNVPINAGTYWVKASVSGLENYLDIEQICQFVITQANIDLPKPIEVVYKKGITLKDISLPKGWIWNDDTQIVNIGEQEFLAHYHDEDGNYKDKKDIKIKVIAKKGNHEPEIILPENSDHSNQNTSHTNEVENNQSNHVMTDDITSLLPIILLSLSGIIIRLTYIRKRKFIKR